MSYIDEIAAAIYRVDEPDGEPTPNDLPLYRIYAVLALAKGTDTTLKDVHDAWSAWQAGLFPGHRSLIPFDQLEQMVQELDRSYCDAIHTVAAYLKATS